MKPILKISLLLLFATPILLSAQATSYDSDGDGVPDSTDQCAYVKGKTTLGGCPAPKAITATDRDGDGVADVKDKCADLYGKTETDGCPNLMMASTNTYSIGPAGKNIYTTVSSSETEENENFKATLQKVIAESRKQKSIPANSSLKVVKAHECIAGANECYLQRDPEKVFYADFGIYSNEAAAAQKYYTLKQKLIEALDTKEWKGAEIARGSYIEKYELTRNGNGDYAQVITTHVQKTADATYSVFVTVAYSPTVATK
jgi:hypothetical protein